MVFPVPGCICGPEMAQARDSPAWLPCTQHNSGLTGAKGASEMIHLFLLLLLYILREKELLHWSE